jgi:hypothetical protein
MAVVILREVRFLPILAARWLRRAVVIFAWRLPVLVTQASSPRRRVLSRLDVLSRVRFTYPAISLWRRDLITTEVEWRGNHKLYCYRFHPHKDKTGVSCSGRFMLTGEQVEVLLEFWSDQPVQRLRLPQPGKTVCVAHRLPDGGLQFLRYTPYRTVASTFRIFAADVRPFLAFAEHGLPRIEAETWEACLSV